LGDAGLGLGQSQLMGFNLLHPEQMFMMHMSDVTDWQTVDG